MEKKVALVDIPVLVLFFSRPNTLKHVFESIREARPSMLFLACDGPRTGRQDDEENIAKCKEIVNNIDWECQVYTRYSNTNLGCGMGPASAIGWALSVVDRVVVIEDDCVVDPSLFEYQKELLERYKNDTRIAAVSGFNHFKDWDADGNSYFFTKTGATLAWGTWRRVWDLYDYQLSNGVSDYSASLLRKEIRSRRVSKMRISEWNSVYEESINGKKLDYWDIQFGFIKFTQSMLTIVPSHNLVCNIGVGIGSTHSSTQKIMNWRPGDILFMPTCKISTPLCHPQDVICDHRYDEKYFNEMKGPNLYRRIIRKIRMFLRSN